MKQCLEFFFLSEEHLPFFLVTQKSDFNSWSKCFSTDMTHLIFLTMCAVRNLHTIGKGHETPANQNVDRSSYILMC